MTTRHRPATTPGSAPTMLVRAGQPEGADHRRDPVGEVGCTWHERIGAPIERVSDAISLDALLAHLPGVRADVALAATSASVILEWRWGPLHRVIPGHAALRQARPPEHLLLVVNLPGLALEYRYTADLIRVAADATNLRSESRLRCAHRYLRRCRTLLGAAAEDHARAVAATVTRQAESRYQASLRLTVPEEQCSQAGE